MFFSTLEADHQAKKGLACSLSTIKSSNVSTNGDPSVSGSHKATQPDTILADPEQYANMKRHSTITNKWRNIDVKFFCVRSNIKKIIFEYICKVYLKYIRLFRSLIQFDLSFWLMLKLNHLKMNWRNETSFWIYLEIRQMRFKDITHVREFTLDDFVGNCGGYIGMFLGYALIQFPQFLQFIFHKIRKEILLRKAQKSARNDINDDVIQLA